MKTLPVFLLLLFPLSLVAQLPAQRVLAVTELPDLLQPEVKDRLSEDGPLTESALAGYYRQHFAQHYFYDYHGVEQRMMHYNGLYGNEGSHENRAMDHMTKYADSTQWVLPFDYLNGEPVNAYALRHLARQHKMVDIILHYFNAGKDPQYIRYFTQQMRSLNAALVAGEYEKIPDGNGVYEAFRSGYRVLNWLWIHNLLLNEPAYTDQDQLYTIATLLQHGQHLYEHNAEFRSGNHQTRGMSALAMLSILFRDIKGTEVWYERAMQRLGEHLDREINPDGFQFERSVHYHMSDINNYYYVYQLAKLSNIPVDAAWENKLRSLFTTLAKVAYPDGTAPVLQDDTEIPWGEKNDISGAMTLGYLLFEDPELGYFASNRVDDRMYWSLSAAQLELLDNVQRAKPTYGSLSFPDTHYYIMRQGWQPNDQMMIISAGVDADKPDHQHGDILGIQAIANQQAILPNYQVRYSLPDFELFKNSMVKNVALVDDLLQGQQWTSNRGGSGFGKFKSLPQPQVIAWTTSEDVDLFVGSHDGFEDIGVRYSRQVVYLRDDFWIVKDNFESDINHAYRQVWQGHYTLENGPGLLRATFLDASGCDIYQLRSVDDAQMDGARGKNWTVVTKEGETNFSFVTAIFPYRGYSNRISEDDPEAALGNWQVNPAGWEIEGTQPISLGQEDQACFFQVTSLSFANYRVETSEAADLFISMTESGWEILSLGDTPFTITVQTPGGQATQELQPGAWWATGL